MTGLVLLALGFAFFVLALHPFVTYPASLRAFRRRPVLKAAPDAPRPSLAVCMCAYNEEAVIAWKARSLIEMAQAYGPAEVYVYVDGAQDRTAERLAEFADRVHVVATGERLGKSAGMRRLVEMSSSELVCFTDANVETPVDGLCGLAAAFADPRVGCATAALSYTNPGETGMSGGGALYWSLEETIKARESETIGVVGVDGAFFMMRRADYVAPPADIIDDLYVSLTALAAGRRVVSAPDVEVRERGAVSSREEFRRKARISCQSWNVHRLMWPQLRRMPPGPLYGYVSHRVLKWLMPYLLLLSLLCGGAGAALVFGPWLVAGAALVAGGLLAAGLALRVRPAQVVAAFVVSLAGVGLGVFQSVALDRRYVTWDIAESVRA